MQKITYNCDKCNREFKEEDTHTIVLFYYKNSNPKHMCKNCSEDFLRWLDKI